MWVYLVFLFTGSLWLFDAFPPNSTALLWDQIIFWPFAVVSTIKAAMAMGANGIGDAVGDAFDGGFDFDGD